MGLFSKSSSSSSTQNFEETTTTIKETGQQDIEGIAIGETGGFGARVNVEVLDAGAVNSAFDFAEESQAYLGESFADVTGLAEDVIDTTADFAEFAVAEQAMTSETAIRESLDFGRDSFDFLYGQSVLANEQFDEFSARAFALQQSTLDALEDSGSEADQLLADQLREERERNADSQRVLSDAIHRTQSNAITGGATEFVKSFTTIATVGLIGFAAWAVFR